MADRINNRGVASNIYVAETHSVLKKSAPEGGVRAEKLRSGKPEIIGIPSKSATGERIRAKKEQMSNSRQTEILFR